MQKSSRTMSSPIRKTVIAFDLYGTLLSTESIAKELATHIEGNEAKANEIAALWRRYQLEYSFRITCMSKYASWYTLTLASLRHALAEHSVSLPAPVVTSLMNSYDSLSVWPDVPAGLQALSEQQDRTAPYIFSNGTATMVSASVKNSEGLKEWSGSSNSSSSGKVTGIAAGSATRGLFRELVTVDKIHGVSAAGGDAYANGTQRAFKPARCVYEGLLSAVHADGERSDDEGLKNVKMSDMWLVTSNPFDVVGALNAGMKAAWVDRGGKGWIDGLAHVTGFDGPTFVASGIDDVVERIAEWDDEDENKT